MNGSPPYQTKEKKECKKEKIGAKATGCVDQCIGESRTPPGCKTLQKLVYDGDKKAERKGECGNKSDTGGGVGKGK